MVEKVEIVCRGNRQFIQRMEFYQKNQNTTEERRKKNERHILYGYITLL